MVNENYTLWRDLALEFIEIQKILLWSYKKKPQPEVKERIESIRGTIRFCKKNMQLNK